MKKLILTVDGMMCGACEAHVADAVRRAQNVKNVKASHASGKVEIVLDEGADAQKIADAIKAEGYAVLGFEEQPYEKTSLFAKLFKKK